MMEILGPKRDNKSVGERSQAIILARLSEVGYNVLIPFGENHRYDLVIEDADRQFWRIQCKPGGISNGCMHFNTSSNNYHHLHNGGLPDYRPRNSRPHLNYLPVCS